MSKYYWQMTVICCFISVILTGCGQVADLVQSEPPSDGAQLIVEIMVPTSLFDDGTDNSSDDEGGAMSSLALEGLDDIVPTTVRVTINKEGAAPQTKEVTIQDGKIEVVFSYIDPGTWTVQAEILDQEGVAILRGSATVTVTTSATTTCKVDMFFEPGSLKVKSEKPAESVSGTATLTISESDVRSGVLVKEGAEWVYTFTNLPPGHFGLEVVWKDSNDVKTHGGLRDVTILPGRETEANVTVKPGTELGISFSWEFVPKPPTAVQAIFTAGAVPSVTVQWNASVTAGVTYNIYRSETEDGTKVLLNATKIMTTSYIDDTIKPGRSYWYWVLSQLPSGVTSKYSQPATVTTSVAGAGKEKILFIRDGVLWMMESDGTNAAPLMGNQSWRQQNPTWSPARDMIAFASDRYVSTYGIFIMNADGTNPVDLTVAHNSRNLYPAWEPNGSRIAFCSDRGKTNNYLDIWVMNVGESAGAALKNLTATSVGHHEHPTWAAGIIAFTYRETPNDPGEIYIMNADGSNRTNLTTQPSDDMQPAFSPDGTKIAFVSDRSGYYHIYIMNVDGSGVRQLTNGYWNAYNPSWSADGLKIVFSADKDHANGEIYVINAENGTGLTRLTNNTNVDSEPSWSAY